MGKTGRTQTAAQKAASELNLRKGNPRAYAGDGDPPPAPPKPAKPRVVRAKAPPARPKPKPRQVPPRAPAGGDPPRQKSGGGFVDGLMAGLGG